MTNEFPTEIRDMAAARAMALLEEFCVVSDWLAVQDSDRMCTREELHHVLDKLLDRLAEGRAKAGEWAASQAVERQKERVADPSVN